MWLEVGCVDCKVVRCTEAERAWLETYLSFTDANARFRKGAGSDRIRMLNAFSMTFPAGLLPLVLARAPEEGFTIECSDTLQAPCLPDADADLEWLRDYQLEAVKRAEARRRGILWCPTGSGKTEIAIGLAQYLPCTWLFLVHKANLMTQTADRYELRTKLPAGRVGDGVWDIPRDSRFIVATFQTIDRRMKRDKRVKMMMEDVRGLIVDECHVLPAWSFWNVSMGCINTHWRIGMSGTPLARGDRRSVFAIAALGPVIYRIKSDVLIERGVIAKPHVRMVRVEHRGTLETTWGEVYGTSITRSARRNSTIVEMARRAKKPALVFVKEIRHGKELEKQLWAAGVKAGFVWGKFTGSSRMTQVKDLVAGRIDVLVCSAVFQEGVDIPELRSVIVASAGKSVIATLQRLGRGMRVERDRNNKVVEGGDEFDVWDVDDTGCGCTERTKDTGELVHHGCKWLEHHSRDRRNAYTREGYETVREEVVPAENS